MSIELADVQAAAARLAAVVHRTPVLTSRTVDELTGLQVFAKCENLQRAGAFKIRGAYNALATHLAELGDQLRQRGVITYSSGNHAQALALAGQLLGVPVTAVMPDDAPTAKRAAAEGYGAQIVTYDRLTEDREEVAARLAAERGFAAVVPPYDDHRVIAGQGTLGLELLDQVRELDVVVVPLGGGGLLSGIATAVRNVAPDVRLVGVETEGADDWVQSRQAGQPVRIPPPSTIADGIRTLAPGTLTWPIVNALVDDVVVVSDDEVRHAMRLLISRMKLVVEPTGAVALAAVLADRVGAQPGARVAVIISGGNIEIARLAELLTSEPPAP